MGGCRSPLPSLASPAQEGGAPPTLRGVLLLLCSRLPDGVTNPPHPTGASLQAACGPTAQPGGPLMGDLAWEQNRLCFPAPHRNGGLSEHLLWARPCAKHFTDVSRSRPYNTLRG